MPILLEVCECFVVGVHTLSHCISCSTMPTQCEMNMILLQMHLQN